MTDREEEKQRIDRELIELLNGLRVALPGVQVLFAFLLILPFQDRFASINDVERWVYFAASRRPARSRPTSHCGQSSRSPAATSPTSRPT